MSLVNSGSLTVTTALENRECAWTLAPVLLGFCVLSAGLQVRAEHAAGSKPVRFPPEESHQAALAGHAPATFRGPLWRSTRRDLIPPSARRTVFRLRAVTEVNLRCRALPGMLSALITKRKHTADSCCHIFPVRFVCPAAGPPPRFILELRCDEFAAGCTRPGRSQPDSGKFLS